MKNIKIVTTFWLVAIVHVGLSANILIHKILQNDKIENEFRETNSFANFTDEEINNVEMMQKAGK